MDHGSLTIPFACLDWQAIVDWFDLTFPLERWGHTAPMINPDELTATLGQTMSRFRSQVVLFMLPSFVTETLLYWRSQCIPVALVVWVTGVLLSHLLMILTIFFDPARSGSIYSVYVTVSFAVMGYALLMPVLLGILEPKFRCLNLMNLLCLTLAYPLLHKNSFWILGFIHYRQGLIDASV